MARNKVLTHTAQPCFLEQVVGPGTGRVFELSTAELLIGRAEESDIILASGSVSRNHALIEIDSEGNYHVSDAGSRNGIQVNGGGVDQAILQNGDIVQIGDFAFRFTNPNVAEAAAVVASAPQSPVETNEAEAQFGFGKVGKVKTPGNKRPLIYGVVLVILGLVYLFGEEDTSTTTESSAKTPVANSEFADPPSFPGLDGKGARLPGSRIKGAEDPTKSRAETALDKLQWDNTAAQESEQYFRRGRREYLSKNFQRAIQSFQTSLSFDRTHKLSQFYLGLAVAAGDEAARDHMRLGVKYFESLQYERAIYHFTQVSEALTHRPKHKMHKQVRKYIAVSEKRLRAAELFP